MTEQEWLASADPAAMLQQLTHGSEPMNLPAGRRVEWRDRKLRLFACACCRQVWDGIPCPVAGSGPPCTQRYIGGPCPCCHGTGRVGGLTDPRSRRAVELAEEMADKGIDGEATAEELRQDHLGTEEVWAGSTGSPHVGWLAYHATFPDAPYAGPRIAEYAHLIGIPPATQAALVRDVFGNPWRPAKRPVHAPRAFEGDETIGDLRFEDDWLRWNDGTVPRLARQIYDERAWERMPLLADALMDAGCDDEELIRHCRGLELIPQPATGNPPLAWYGPLRGPHVRGCWAIDAILGRE